MGVRDRDRAVERERVRNRSKGRIGRATGGREETDVRVSGLQLPFITLLGPIDITDWYSALMPPSKDPTEHHEGG